MSTNISTPSSNLDRSARSAARTVAGVILAVGIVLAGCERPQDSTVAHDDDHSAGADHDHDHGDHAHDHLHDHGDHAEDHDHAHGADHSHGEMTELGRTAVGPFTVRVSRSGEFAAGADVVVDVWIEDAPPTGGSRPATVRAWIGSEDAAGTVRTRLSSPSPADATVAWHEHLEAPAELGDAPQLWIEIETEDGTRHRGSIAAVPGT